MSLITLLQPAGQQGGRGVSWELSAEGCTCQKEGLLMFPSHGGGWHSWGDVKL